MKWAGGKRNLLEKLRPLVPQTYGKYIEPFVGGGALFFALCPAKAVLSDLNSELMDCYKVIRDKPDELIRSLGDMTVDERTFYSIRAKIVSDLGDVERAARLIYLNKTCYNGLYRVNKKGQFNTPFGYYERVQICNKEVIYAASRALQNAEIVQGDFEHIILAYAEPGDFAYLDPPYPPIGRFSDFKRYTKEFFYEEDQLRLAKVVRRLDRKGCKFILSNSSQPIIQKLYGKFRKIDVEAPRYINCCGDGRGGVSELIITNIKEKE